MPGDLLILCYHAVSESWPASLSVTAADFESQLTRLIRKGYVGTTLSGIGEREASARTLVVTFDDGYLSTLRRAAPILEKLELPATLFVPTDYIGQAEPMRWIGVDRWIDSEHEEELTPLDWDQVRELAKRDWEIGSHTCSHPKLTQLDDAQLQRELADSRSRIELELNRPCPAIAYPYGDVDTRVAAAAASAGYKLGAALPHRWTGDTDPLLLPRVGIYNGQRGLKLGAKLSPTVRRLRLALGR